MAKNYNETIKTPVADLKYCFINGKGKAKLDGSGNPSTTDFEYTASIMFPEGSETHKAIETMLDNVWANAKDAQGIKQAKPKSNGLKQVKDKETDEPTGDMLFSFKTNATWSDGKAQIIEILNGKGEKITSAMAEQEIGIGDGSRGVIHGSVGVYLFGGKYGLTPYLKAVQLAKLVKFTGSNIEADELDEAEDIDLGGSMPAIDDNEAPAL